MQGRLHLLYENGAKLMQYMVKKKKKKKDRKTNYSFPRRAGRKSQLPYRNVSQSESNFVELPLFSIPKCRCSSWSLLLPFAQFHEARSSSFGVPVYRKTDKQVAPITCLLNLAPPLLQRTHLKPLSHLGRKRNNTNIAVAKAKWKETKGCNVLAVLL